MLVLCISIPTQAKELTLTQSLEAVCRVQVSNGSSLTRQSATFFGTGTVVKEDIDKGLYYILTNGHVVGLSNTDVTVEFFQQGYKTPRIPAKVAWRFYVPGTTADMAILVIKSSIFKGGMKPRVIPLIEKEDFALESNQRIYGAGCPSGRWAQAWITRVKEVKTNVFSFLLAPEGGQSGTGVLTTVKDSQGELQTRVCGILSWRMGNRPANYGAAVSFQRIIQMLNGTAKPDKVDVDYMLIAHEVKAGICDKCGYSKCQHFHIIDENGEIVKNTSTKNSLTHIPYLYCPTDIARIKAVAENSRRYCRPYCKNPQCPNKGQGPQLPPSNPNEDNNPFNDNELPPLGIGPEKPGTPKDSPPNIWGKPELTPPKNEPAPAPKPDGNIKKIEDLEKKIKELEAKADILSKGNAGLEGQKKVIEKQLADTKLLLEKMKADKGFVDTNLKVAKDANKTLAQKLDISERNLDWTGAKNVTLLDKAKAFKNKLQIPFFEKLTGEGTSIPSLIIAWLLSTGLITTVWHKWLYPRIMNRFGWFPAKIIQRIAKGKLDKYVDNAPKIKVPKFPDLINRNDIKGLFNKDSEDLENAEKEDIPVEKFQDKEYYNIDPPKIVDIVNTVVFQSLPLPKERFINKIKFEETHYPDDFAKDFFKQNKNKFNGWTVEDWVFRASLYEQAINAMLNGKLLYKNSSKLNGQEKAARVIEDYVLEKLYQKVSVSKISKNPYHIAFMGFLYWEAVNRLSNNGFGNVLGSEDIAKEIDKYVHARFLELIKGD